jgi:hypothetical protein
VIRGRLLIMFWALDHLVLAVVTLGDCRPYEMISSALFLLKRDGKLIGRVFVPIVDFLLRPLGKDHCEQSYLWQKGIYK